MIGDPAHRAGPSGPTPCPTCGKPATERDRPFCSKRCADVDLHRWFSGAYGIPVEDHEPEDASDETRDP